MKIEVLCAAMHADMNVANALRLQTGAVIINQCEREDYAERKIGDFCVRMYSHSERGVGRSRNCALLHAQGDILIFADDDIEYVDGYASMVLHEFETQKDADMLVFNIDVKNSTRHEYTITKREKLKLFNCLRYGAVRFAIKREALMRKNIWFSLLFGGGAKYSSGEDSVFISDCIKAGLSVYTTPEILCSVDMSDSTWFSGYNEKYFSDKGALLCAIHGALAYPFVTKIILKKYCEFKGEVTLKNALAYAFRGIKEYRRK